MDSCYYAKTENCINNQPPSSEYECCTQTADHNGKPIEKNVFGLWVQKGSCNQKTGTCRSNGRMAFPPSTGSLTETIRTNEGYSEKSCTTTNLISNIVWLLAGLVFLVLLMYQILNAKDARRVLSKR